MAETIVVHPPQSIAPAVTVIERTDSNGWGWSLAVIALPAGGTLIYSPSWLDGTTLERVAALGEPRVLVAPNHWHNASLDRFAERFPEARVVASETALPRLRKQVRAQVEELEAVDALLPEGAKWHRALGTKSGEAWLTIPHARGRTLLVCDAFFRVQRPTRGFIGFLLRQLSVVPGLRISTTYRLLALRDVPAYQRWARDAIATIAPTEVMFCHGEPLIAPDCSAQLLAAIEQRWPPPRG